MRSWRTVAAALLPALVLASPLSSVVDKRQSNIPLGVIINSCTVPGTVAVTFDDGPYIYTSGLLDLLDQNGFKATFFVNGQNYDSIYNYQSVLQRMVNEGHQIGSHTWNHADLTTLSVDGITSEMTQLEDALLSLVGGFPTYMRPPYFATNAQVLSTLGGLGYHVIQCDVDTLDWQYNTADTIQNSVNIYRNALANGATINLSHDPLPNTVETLVPAMIQAIQARGLRPVTVGECLGDPSSNWYRQSRSGGTTPPPSGGNPPPTGTVDPNGTCGGPNGYVCDPSSCCSQYGWCGTTSDYCNAGCQSAFGTCSGGGSGGTTPPPTGGSGGTSPDGTCGSGNGYVCPNGECCSQWGWCGSDGQYCGAGCQAGFGGCS